MMFKARFIPLNVTQAASQLKRSSHCLVVPPTQDAAIVFGGELQPRVPVDNALHEIALPSGNYGLKNVLTATSAPPPSRGICISIHQGILVGMGRPWRHFYGVSSRKGGRLAFQIWGVDQGRMRWRASTGEIVSCNGDL